MICDWCGAERECRRIEAEQDVCHDCLVRKKAKCFRAFVKLVAVTSCLACGREPVAPVPCTKLTAVRADTGWTVMSDGQRKATSILYQCPR